jgi:ubiquinone/menaquinone biosynthesis C-methylase UbiE
MTVQEQVVAHYGRGDLLARIDDALRAAGKDPERPAIEDLAPVDEFHSRGRQATEELAGLLPERVDGEVLDIGSGLGGPARFLAAARGLRVVGVDLTPEYVAVANELARRCGLADRVRFLTADATDLPFPAASFAAACTQHVAMNVENKTALYAEAARVLRPGATFVIHDLLQRPGGQVHYPTPWSADDTLERLLEAAGFIVQQRRDRRAETLAWFEARAAAAAASRLPPTGIHLLLGTLFAPAFANLVAGLREFALAPMLVRAVRR